MQFETGNGQAGNYTRNDLLDTNSAAQSSPVKWRARGSFIACKITHKTGKYRKYGRLMWGPRDREECRTNHSLIYVVLDTVFATRRNVFFKGVSFADISTMIHHIFICFWSNQNNISFGTYDKNND